MTVSVERSKRATPFAEFVIILSLLMALTALSIDAMLPALSSIGSELGVARPNDRQMMITIIFFGQAIGQLFFGPLSDKVGRKPAIFSGYILFILGSLLSLFSRDFPTMLAGRALQGLGVAAPRVVSMALVRDKFEGRKMARVMSFISTVFILIPMIAPSIGQGIVSIAGWRSIFSFFVIFALITLTWFSVRIPETLALENRKPFSLRAIFSSTVEILKIRTALGYTLAIGLVQGAFLGYINSSQQIFQEQYALGERFPLFFSTVALSLGIASLVNTRLVMRYGMRLLVRWAFSGLIGLAVLFGVIAFIFSGQPPLWMLMTYLMASFFCIGILFGNLNSMAMQPLGHLAGIGAAIVGSFSALLATLLGMVIGRSYNGTILPFMVGMVVLSSIAVFVSRWAEVEKD